VVPKIRSKTEQSRPTDQDNRLSIPVCFLKTNFLADNRLSEVIIDYSSAFLKN